MGWTKPTSCRAGGDFLDIVMELRKRHRIQIPEDDYINLASMNSTVTYLVPLLKDIEREKV